MSRYLPIAMALLLVLLAFALVYNLKHHEDSRSVALQLGTFNRQQNCSIQPPFLSRLKIPQPIAIDLSQDRYRGLAFLFGQRLSRAIHLKAWERFDYFSGYVLDQKGNMYLTPMPYISVKPKTFDLQKNIYKLEGNSGKLSIWMSLDEVKAGSTNPFGIIAIAYDCDDDTLWVAAIDETDYTTQRGIIYHIDIKQKKILQRVKRIDALSLKLLHTQRGKYLLLGSARENTLCAFSVKEGKLSAVSHKIFSLPDANEHVRKIMVRGHNHLEIQTIPFAYTLLAQTAQQGVRSTYDAFWDVNTAQWKLSLKK